VYVVTIDARGNVTFEGRHFVRVEGKATDTIPVARVAELVETARQIVFFEMEDHYTALITDLPTTLVTITTAGQTKHILDYWGAPAELKKLEKQIDGAARTERWIHRDTAPPQQPAGGAGQRPR